MIKHLKRLPFMQTLLAIAFLFVQIGTSLYLPYVTAKIVNNGVAKGDTHYIWRQGLVMIIISLVGLIGAMLNTLLFTRIAYRLGGEVRAEVYDKVLSFSKTEFDYFGSSSLITRNTNDVTQIQSLVETSLKFLLMAPIQLFGGILMTWLLSPKLALIFIEAVPFLVVTYFFIYKFANPLYSHIQQLMDRLNLTFKEGLTGARVIRAFNKENQEFEKYDALNEEYAKTSVKAGTIMGFFIPALSLLLSLATLIIVWRGAGFVAAGSMKVGTIIGAVGYAAQILSGFAMLTFVIMMIPKGQISAKRVNEVLDQPLSIQDASTEQTETTEQSLVFENVDFRYLDAPKKTLFDLNFGLKAGQTLAIIGSTGDGKTSLVNLVARLYDVESGQVRLNGIDVKAIPQATLHEKISYTPQTTMLFFGTIRSNMLVGNPAASDEEIWQALASAQAKEFVAALPDGLDSVVEKAGGNFSGGQRQRLCIARALLKPAEVYIFDDSFSALDFATDQAVRHSMKAQTKDAMTIIVAQRIATVRDADIIAVLDQGTIVGLGTHEELQAENEVYQQIVKSQTYQEGE